MKSHSRNRRDFSIASLMLVTTAAVSILIGVGLQESQLSAWGSWVGAFIAGIAMIASGYAILIQARHGESASWNIALGRLGEIYDQAYGNDRLSEILTEQTDPDGNNIHIDPDTLNLSPREIVWFGNLFLAFEQIYVATISLSHESQRVWRLYLKNQLNKPFIRAAFINDASNSKDFHQEFWRFIRGNETLQGYKDYAINPKFFSQENKKNPAAAEEKKPFLISVEPLHISEGPFWLDMYRDKEVIQQMYAAPIDSVENLLKYLKSRFCYTLFIDKEPVGGFTITKEKEKIASFGIVLHPTFRKVKYSKIILRELEKKAKELGFSSLRADVYSDNLACIKSLHSSGYRKFIWFEKNLPEI